MSKAIVNIINEIPTVEEMKSAADKLAKMKQGCIHWVLGKVKQDDKQYTLAVVLGWFYTEDGHTLDRYYDDGYRLAIKIAVQPGNSLTQCDYDIDWSFPRYSDSDDYFDIEGLLSDETDFNEVQKSIHYGLIILREDIGRFDFN